MTSENLVPLLPEIVLAVAAIGIYMAGAFVESPRLWRWIVLAALALAGIALWTGGGDPPQTVVADPLALYGRWFSLAAGTILLLMAWRPVSTSEAPEYCGTLLLLISGLMLASAAGDLVLVFVGLELVSIPTYILLYLGRRDTRSQESTAKYFYLSILSSATLLYGLSFLYGMAGRTDLHLIHAKLIAGGAGSFAILARAALVLILAGLGFRIAAVPFHFYAPDVYQGATHANAGLLAVAPKIAGLIVLIRLTRAALPGIESYAWIIVLILAILTMTLGNVTALWQKNLRRLLAYSSIAQAGYMLIGLAVYLASRQGAPARWDGISGLLLYLLVYSVATLGTFAALAALDREDRPVAVLDDLAGLFWSAGVLRPLLAATVALCMFSLVGIPPLAGFWGKLAVFGSSLSLDRLTPDARPWFVILAGIGVLNSAVSAVYYLRIVGVMFFRPPQETPGTTEEFSGSVVAAVSCACLAVAIGVYPGPWIHQADLASPSRAAPVIGESSTRGLSQFRAPNIAGTLRVGR
jgi:NADH-quinone oxidoreductase subunit N